MVVTTTTDLKSITESVGGDRAAVTSIASGYEDPHFVDAKPSYMLKARQADLFIRIGLELEKAWEGLIIEGSRNIKIRVGNRGHLDVSQGIKRLQIPTQRVDRSMGDIHPYGNSHYWLDPLNAMVIAETIAKRLTEISPENKDYFLQNASEFKRRIDEKMKGWKAKMSPFKGKKIITYHNSWPYFARRFNLNVVDHIEPKPGIPPSSRHLIGLIRKIKSNNIKVILMEPFYSDRAPNFIASKTGAAIVKAANSVGGMEGADDYIQLIDRIIAKLAAAF